MNTTEQQWGDLVTRNGRYRRSGDTGAIPLAVWETIKVKRIKVSLRVMPRLLIPLRGRVSATEMFDIAFLDTEPSLIFNEFEKFYNNVNPGGLIIIHDLHPHLSYGCVNLDHPEFKHWPYGDFREKLGIYIKSHQVQTFSFSTPRGITIFQKSKPVMSYLDLINGVL